MRIFNVPSDEIAIFDDLRDAMVYSITESSETKLIAPYMEERDVRTILFTNNLRWPMLIRNRTVKYVKFSYNLDVKEHYVYEFVNLKLNQTFQIPVRTKKEIEQVDFYIHYISSSGKLYTQNLSDLLFHSQYIGNERDHFEFKNGKIDSIVLRQQFVIPFHEKGCFLRFIVPVFISVLIFILLVLGCV